MTSPSSRLGQVHLTQHPAVPHSTPSCSRSGATLSTTCTRRCLGAADYLLTSGGRVARQRGAQAGGLASGQAPCTHRIHRRNAKAANLTRRSRGKAAPAPRQTRIGGLSQGRQTSCLVLSTIHPTRLGAGPALIPCVVIGQTQRALALQQTHVWT